VRAVLYAAKSTEDRRGSIGTQLEECRDRAEQEGWLVIGEFSDEAFSAYHGNRGDGLARAMAACEEAGGDVALIVQHSDRLARGNVKDARHLVEYAIRAIKQSVRLDSLQDPEMLAEGDYGLLMSTIGGMRNHQDSKRKAESVKAGIKRRRAKGKAWGEPPLGYQVERSVVDGEVVSGRAIDPEARLVVEALFEGLDAGASTGEVARKLNRAGYRTKRGHEFTARRVRAMAENSDYKGDGPYPQLIDSQLWERVNDKIRRADPAGAQHAGGGRQPKADFMLRRLAFCGECGQPVYSLVRHGKRIYECRTRVRGTGTCDAQAIPADLVEARVLDHLSLFLEDDLDIWIGEQLAQRSDEQVALQSAVDAKRLALLSLEARREQRMAELENVGITAVGLEVIDRIDRDHAALRADIDDGEAVLSEWTARVSADGVLDFYTRLRDLVSGRVARADGVAEINAILHDSLRGIWLAYDGETLSADIRVRPSGDPVCDLAVTELFGALPSREESMAILREALPEEFSDEGQLSDHEHICAGSTTARSSAPFTTAPRRPYPQPRNSRAADSAGPVQRTQRT
jgi:DNA invertase Pin-like site-specific DNA recombinase